MCHKKNKRKEKRGRPELKVRPLSHMIITVKADINEIYEKGKNYPWKKPDKCPNCHDTVIWGHGSVLCYFACILVGIYLKRYRCPGCHCVMKLKPVGYFRKFQTSIAEIHKSVTYRIKNGKYKKEIPRSRQHWWYRNLRKKVLSYLGLDWKNRLTAGFSRLILIGMIPVSSAI